MNSTATPIDSHSGRLFHLSVLRVAGAGRFDFLQGQISNDTRRLAAGRPLLAACSNVQGRVAAVLHLLPHSTGILGILPTELLPPTLERLRKFVLRAKVTIEDAGGEFSVAGHHGAAALHAARLQVPDPAQGYLETDGVGVGRIGASSERFWIVGAAARLAALGLGGDVLEAERIECAWRLADIRAGLPQIYAATREMFVAQMLNLDLVDGISFNKGCYTGQEIIARAQHLGRIKRRLTRLALRAGDFSIGGTIRLGDGRAGRLTELARSGDGFEALAVVNLDADAQDLADAAGSAPGGALAHDPAAADELPLPYRR